MSGEDRLRDAFRRADAALPDRGLDWEDTMKRAGRARARFTAGFAAAALLLVAAGIGAAVVLRGDGSPDPIPPVTTTEPSPRATAGSPSPAPAEGECSADGVAVPATPFGDAPFPVQETHARLVELAAACDFDGLAELASRSDAFTFTFGAEDDPADHWRALDEEEEVIAALLKILGMSHDVQTDTGGGEPIYVWPGAFLGEPDGGPTEAEWDEVRAIYSDGEIEQMKRFGSYIGYRVGITESGDWIFFVAGD